ncbi:MAG: hypothetical protein HRT89_04220, partial [Lentisphaeria bacterium]|nr:hypothetical protein [Lentisphaeria bacterium]NQZ67256.1 hypothetical protein [Lentisphaeria bacterium]
MTYKLQKPQKPSYKGPVLRSLILHAIVFTLIWAALNYQARAIQKQEEEVINTLRDQEEAAIAEEIAAEEAFAKETAKEELRDEISPILTTEQKSESSKQLLEKLNAELESLFADNPDIDDQQAMDELRMHVIDSLAKSADDLLIEALIAQIRKYIKTDLAPKLISEMERNLKNPGGIRLDKAIQAFVQKHRAKSDAAIILYAALDPLHKELADQIEISIKRDLVPPASEKVLTAFAKEISKLNVDAERLKPMIKDDIVKAMIEEMLAAKRDEKIATLRSEARHKIIANEDLEESQKELTEQIKELDTLISKQEELLKDIAEEKTEAVENAEKQIAEMDKFYEKAADTLHKAENQTLSWQSKTIKAAKKMADAKTALKPTEKAKAALEFKNSNSAKLHAEYARRQLVKLSNTMKASEKALENEMKKRSDSSTPKEPNQQQTEMSQKMLKGLQSDIAAVSKESSQSAVKNIKVENVLGDLSEDLKAALELSQKIANAKSKLKDGRQIDSGDLAGEMESLLAADNSDAEGEGEDEG